MDYLKILADAESRHRVVVSELAQLEKLIASAKELSKMAHPAQTAADTRRPKRATTSNLTRIITREILTKRGTPMKTVELLPLLRDRGVEVGGKDPIATLSARLSNTDEFESNRKEGWWFAGVPRPSGDTIFEETEGRSCQAAPSASNATKGDSSDAAALDT